MIGKAPKVEFKMSDGDFSGLSLFSMMNSSFATASYILCVAQLFYYDILFYTLIL